MKKAIFNNGVTEYKVITATEPSKPENSIAQNIVDVFKNLGGVELAITNEYTDGKKIIIGNANDTSASIKASLSERDYTVRFIDDVIYFIGGSDYATAKAWLYFQLNFMHKDMNSLYLEDGFAYDSNTGTKADLTISGNNIQKYTIVHYDGHFAQKCANDIKNAIFNKTGIELEVVDDSTEEREYEILVGKTNRDESKGIRAKYDRPHIYYDVETVNNKLVVMAEGFTTLEMVSVELEAYLNSMTETDINGNIISRNIKYYIDVDMIDKTEGTDLRVWSWNMSAPYMRDYLNSSAVYKDDKVRGEVMADVLATYYPDIIGTCELFNSKMSTNYQDHYASVARELSDYYSILEESPYEYGKPNEDVMPNLRYGIPENVMYKKMPELSFVRSGWRYPHSLEVYHGYHQATFDLAGKRFIYSIAHYGPSHQDDKYALDHQDAINDAQAANGGSDLLPVIFSGDLWMYHGDVGHKTHTDVGYLDAQRSAEINVNGCLDTDTCHAIGFGARKYLANCCDFIFHSDNLTAKKFSVMRTVNTDNTSDHYPLCADFKFN